MFADRAEAGRHLADALIGYLGDATSAELVVLALPRGGVPVGAAVAGALRCPLDVIMVRKLGVPSQPELAMGAIGEDGARVVDAAMVAATGVCVEHLAAVEARERRELVARTAAVREGHDRIPLAGKIAVIVDDGIATGATARVACAVARQLGAVRVLVAVPVAPARTFDPSGAGLGADGLVCVRSPDPFIAVSAHYRDFSPPRDEEVVRLLTDARRRTE